MLCCAVTCCAGRTLGAAFSGRCALRALPVRLLSRAGWCCPEPAPCQALPHTRTAATPSAPAALFDLYGNSIYNASSAVRAYYKNERGPSVTLYVPTTNLYVYNGSKSGSSGGGLSAGAIAGIVVGAVVAAKALAALAWVALRRRQRRRQAAAAVGGGGKGGMGVELQPLETNGSGTSSEVKGLYSPPSGAGSLASLPEGYPRAPGASSGASGGASAGASSQHSSGAGSGQLQGLPELAELVRQHDAHAAASSGDLGRLGHEPRTPPVTHVLLSLDSLPRELAEWTVHPSRITYLTHPNGQLQVLGVGGSARVLKASYNGAAGRCNSGRKWAASNQLTCSHGLGACTAAAGCRATHPPLSAPPLNHCHPPTHTPVPRRRRGGCQGVCDWAQPEPARGFRARGRIPARPAPRKRGAAEGRERGGRPRHRFIGVLRGCEGGFAGRPGKAAGRSEPSAA